MNKKIKQTLFIILTLLILTPSAFADGVGISASSRSITKGQTATIYVTVNSNTPLVSIEGSMSCSGAGVSTGLDLRYDDSSNSVKSKNYSLAVRPTATGTITCSTSGTRITNMSSDNWIGLNNASVTINVGSQTAVAPKKYSTNNNLKSLSVEGAKIDFNKDTLEYNIEVENNVNKVKIDASTEDTKARVDGIGEREVKEGANKLEVVVTAENGNTKTYTINVTVKELKPINVKVNNKEYTIIRKEDVLNPPSAYYEKTTIKIDNEDVLAYTNKKNNITLIGLKDKKGQSSYYIYKDGKYTPYNEYDFGNITLYIIDNKNKIPKNYTKQTIKYKESNITAYHLSPNSDYYIFYAMNVENGKESLYLYDNKEKTVQRYTEETAKIYKDQAKTYLDYLIVVGTVISVIILVLFITKIITTIVNRKKKTKTKYKKSEIKDPREKDIDKVEDIVDTIINDKASSNKKKK